VVYFLFARLAMASEAENSVSMLHRFQATVAMTSELDLSVLHPPMAEKTPFPLHSIIQWDVERLRRVARWRASDEAGKDIVRAYAKVVLALQELETASHRISLHGSGSTFTVPPEVLTKPPLAHPPVATAAVVLKSALRSRASEETGAQTGARVGRLVRWKPPASCGGKLLLPTPPTILFDILRSWQMAFSAALQIVLCLLQWAPLLLVTIGLCIMFADPLLLLKLAWKGITLVPRGVRGLLESPLEPTAVPFEVQSSFSATFPHPQPPPVLSAAPDPALVEVCVSTSWMEWFSVVLLAGEGGGAAMFAAQRRGWF
jgi:hypothetical protein